MSGTAHFATDAVRASVTLPACALVLAIWATALGAQEIDPELASLEARLGELRGEDRIEALIRLADHYGSAQPEAGLAYALEAAELLDPLDQPARLALALNHAAWAEQVLGRYEDGLAHAREAERLAEVAGDRVLKSDALNLQGILHYRSSDYANAKLAYEASLALRQEVGDKRLIGNSYNNLASLHNVTGEFEKALELHRQALAMRREVGDEALIAGSLNNIANGYQNLGLYELAAEHFHQSLEIKERLGRRLEAARVLGNLGSLYNSVGDPDRAIEYLERAIRIQRELGYSYGVAINSAAIAEALIELDRLDDALRWLDEGQQVAEASGDDSNLATILSLKGTVFTRLEDFSRAEEALQRALELADRIDSDTGLMDVLLRYGRLHIAAGVPEAAIGLLQRGLARAQAIGSRAMQRDLHAALSDAQAASGYHRRALEHLRTAANLRNELLDTQTHAQINVLNTSYEKQLREREIEALRAENSLAQATLERQTWLRRAYVGGTVAAFVVILFIFARRAHARELAIEREGKARLQARVDERTAELKAANDHLTQTLENLSATQEQLVEAEKMASMGALVAGVAHQINTPLGVAITAASQLQDNTRRLRSAGSADDREQRLEATLERSEQFCDLLNQNLERAAGLVRSFKRVAADQTKVARREFDVLETLEPVLKSFRGQAQSSGHELILENELQPGTRITSYPAAFRQILTNLLDNALMHGLADRQNGEVRVSLGWSGDGQLQLTIADNGAGIDEETRAHLFEPFYTTRQDRGRTGLGLHGVFNLVTRLLRGTISCDARPGEGAVFTIRIPSVE